MLGNRLTPSSLGTRTKNRERKEPTTTDTKEADILLLRPAQGPRSVVIGPRVCGGMTSHANCSVGCFPPRLLFSLDVFLVSLMSAVETEELRDERVVEEKAEGGRS